MTTETLTAPSIESTATPATTPATTSNTYSVLGLVLSILSIPTGMGPLALGTDVANGLAQVTQSVYEFTETPKAETEARSKAYDRMIERMERALER